MPTSPLPLHSEALGRDGAPVVLLHGFGTNGYTWSRWAPKLSEEHRLHIVEMKGFGEAPKPRDHRYSPQHQADLLQRWILENDLHDITLVGHSLGGGVALLTALRESKEATRRIKRLVLVASIAYPQPVPRALRFLARPFLGPLALRLLPKKRVIRTALRMAYHPANPVSESYVEAYARPLRTAEARQALSCSAAQLLPPGAESLAGEYRKIELPTLLLWGRQDRVVPTWVGERLSRELPEARLEIVDECGHMPQEEKPAESLERFRTFFLETT